MSVYLRNGNYYIDYYLPNGNRKREMVSPDKKLAETVLYKRKVEIAEGKFLDCEKKEKIKFVDFSKEYLNLYSKQHKKSWRTDSHHIDDFNGFFRDKYLYEITAKDIEHVKVERLKEVTPSTVNRQLGVLRGMLNKAIAWGKLKNNPMKSVQFYKEPQGRLRFLEREEIITLLDNCEERIKPIVTLAIFTGMRRGEILGLKWSEVDYRRSIITLLDTKNGDKRELPMNDQVSMALINIKKHPESAYIFCYDNGERILDLRKSFATALKKSAIIGFRFHDLRHTFASQLVMSGIDLNTVRELLGHKDMTMTLRYSHLAPSHKQRAVDILSKQIVTVKSLSDSSSSDAVREMPQVASIT
jgi:integrase